DRSAALPRIDAMCQWRLSAPQQTSILYSITSSARAGIRHSRNETLWNVRAASLWLDVGRPDHLAPLLGFVGDEPAKVGGREHKWCAPHVGEPRLHFGIEEASVNLLVEFLDDLGRRAQPTSPDIPYRRGSAGKHHLHLPAEQIIERRPG